jgi:hypothetical protein
MSLTRILALLVVLALAAPAAASEPTSQTFQASVEHVWTTTLKVLKQLDWDIDKSDRSIGWITTDSRRVEGENYAVYEKGTRHRLTLHIKAVGENRTQVSVERKVFKRERILFIDKDEPLTVTERDVERSILAAIGKSL